MENLFLRESKAENESSSLSTCTTRNYTIEQMSQYKIIEYIQQINFKYQSRKLKLLNKVFCFSESFGLNFFGECVIIYCVYLNRSQGNRIGSKVDSEK